MKIKTLVDLIDESGDDPNWFVPAGTICEVVSDEEDWLIVKSEGKGCFPVEDDKWEIA